MAVVKTGRLRDGAETRTPLGSLLSPYRGSETSSSAPIERQRAAIVERGGIGFVAQTPPLFAYGGEA
jgi:hypothetical protein